MANEQGPTGPVQTVAQAQAWVEAHVTPDQLKHNGHKSATAALTWFVAFRQAEELRDSMGGREWVELVIHGLPPLDLTGVDEEWAEFAQEEADSDEPFDLTSELEDFFTDRRNQR